MKQLRNRQAPQDIAILQITGTVPWEGEDFEENLQQFHVFSQGSARLLVAGSTFVSFWARNWTHVIAIATSQGPHLNNDGHIGLQKVNGTPSQKRLMID